MMVTMIRSGILAFCFATVAAGGAWAQSPPSNPVLSGDRTQMVSCLSQSGTPASSCIGSVAVTCVREASGDRRVAEADCARREEAVWRERLTFASLAVMRNAEGGARGQFAALQVAWEGYAAQKCAFYGSMQPSARVAGMQAGCMLREVASRSLELERMVGQSSPVRRPSNPPSITR